MKRNFWILTAIAIGMWGCSPARYRELADKDTYRIIGEKQQQVFGEATPGFTIERQPLPEFMPDADAGLAVELHTEEKPIALEQLTVEELDELQVSDEKIAELIIPSPPNAVKLTLVQALELAVANSRTFQAEKESLFLRALSLTYQRHLWRPQLGLSGSVSGSRDGDEESIGGEGKFSVGQLLASGANLAWNLGTNFAEFFTGDRRRAIGSLLSFTFSQPLLRGGGRLVAMEGLTQAERNVVYEVRSFARYRRSFSVQVAQNYYQTLESRDNLINNFRNYIVRWKDTVRLEEMYKQKRKEVTLLDVDEARQSELSANNAWVFARQTYLDDLDRFKISPLGLPTEAPIVLDENELERLRKETEEGLRPPEITSEEAVRRALANRLDLINAMDSLEDSERSLAIARDALRAGLDISISTSADTEAPTKALKFQFDEGSYSAGLTADFPIDRKQERNAYRQALIALESQKRSLSLSRDNIKLEVRQAYRSMEQTRKRCEILRMSVALATRRVDNAVRRHDLGQATTRDVLFARTDLLDAENQYTSALVDHEMAKLQLLLSTEELRVNEKGLWVEQEPPQRGDENVETTKRPESEKEELSQS